MQIKKPKFWDYKKPNLLSLILWPFSKLVEFSYYLKKKNIKFNSNIKTICVGNIYVGGTGKTSLAIKIFEILKKRKFKTCFIKKFYENQIDEQRLLKNYGKVFLSKKRADALNQAINENYEFAIFDDGLQDYSINYDIKLVCFNDINMIGNGMIIPAGPLREKFDNLKYHKYAFLNGNSKNSIKLINKIKKINPNITIFKGEYCPLNLNEFDLSKNYIAFSGIGNHETFISMLKSFKFKIVKNIQYADHYNYKKSDIKEIIRLSKKYNCEIITTEKDYLRLDNFREFEIKYIKSELNLQDEEKLINAILS